MMIGIQPSTPIYRLQDSDPVEWRDPPLAPIQTPIIVSGGAENSETFVAAGLIWVFVR